MAKIKNVTKIDLSGLGLTETGKGKVSVGLGSGTGTTLATASGGTGQTSYTNGQILIGKSSDNSLAKASITADAPLVVQPGNGTINLQSAHYFSLEGDSGSNRSVFHSNTLEVLGGTNIATTIAQGTDTNDDRVTIDFDGTLPVASGGTGATSLTDKAVLISQDSGTDTVGSVAMSTNGKLLIGGTDGPAVNDLTAGDGIASTTGNGTLELAVDLKANGGLEIQSNKIAVDLQHSNITGTLQVADGGTGATSLNDLITLGDHTTGNYVVGASTADGIGYNYGVSGDARTLNLNLLGDIVVAANSGNAASILLEADDSTDAGDSWKFIANTDHSLTIGNDKHTAGTHLDHFKIIPHTGPSLSETIVAGELTLGGNKINCSDGSLTMELDNSDNVDIKGDLTVSGGDISGTEDGSLTLKSDTDLIFQVDADQASGAGDETFQFKNGGGTEIAQINESGDLQIDGDLTVSGGDAIIKAANDTAASLLLQADNSDDAGDDWKIHANTDQTFSIGNDIDTEGTFVKMLTITPHATATSSTVAVAGSLRLGSNKIIAADDSIAATFTGSSCSITGDLIASAGTITAKGANNQDGILYLQSDNNDDMGDSWKITSAQSNQYLSISNNAGSAGAYNKYFSIIPNATTTSSLVHISGILKIGANVIQASDGGNTITLDTDDKVSIAGSLEVGSATNKWGDGYHGNSTKIALLPSDFNLNNDSGTRSVSNIQTDDDGGSSKTKDAAKNYYAMKIIPKGFTATHVRVNCSSSFVNAVTPHDGSIANDTINSHDIGATNSDIAFSGTDPVGDGNTYVIVEFDPSSTSDAIYGGTITIART